MKHLIRRCAIAATTACAALVSTSCYYDPAVYGSSGYVSESPSPPPNYSWGFGAGYGYGHPGFSTSFFVSTGNARWGYDPYSYAYYDYVSRRYYDPYLCGYYPYGYRPRVIYGVPHVHGYRRGYCPPPRVVNNHILHGYRDRVSAYHRSGRDWGRYAGWQRSSARGSGYGSTNRPFVEGQRPSRGGAATYQQNRGNASRYQQASPSRHSGSRLVNNRDSYYGNRNPYSSNRQAPATRNRGNRRYPSNAVIGDRSRASSRQAPASRQQAAPRNSGNRSYGNRSGSGRQRSDDRRRF